MYCDHTVDVVVLVYNKEKLIRPGMSRCPFVVVGYASKDGTIRAVKGYLTEGGRG